MASYILTRPVYLKLFGGNGIGLDDDDMEEHADEANAKPEAAEETSGDTQAAGPPQQRLPPGPPPGAPHGRLHTCGVVWQYGSLACVVHNPLHTYSPSSASSHVHTHTHTHTHTHICTH